MKSSTTTVGSLSSALEFLCVLHVENKANKHDVSGTSQTYSDNQLPHAAEYHTQDDNSDTCA